MGFSLKSIKRNVLIAACFLPLFILIVQFKNRDVKKVSNDPIIVVSTGTIKRGGSLYQSLNKEGVKDEQIQPIIRSLRPKFNPRHTKPGDHYELFRTTSGHFLKLRYWVDKINYYDVIKSTRGIHSKKMTLPLIEVTMGIAGTIGSSLWEALSTQGIEPDLIYRFVEIFAWQIDFLTEPRVGDRFKMVWKRKQGNGVTIDGEILAALYSGKGTGKVTAIQFGDGYYMPDGKSMQRQFLRAPLKFRRISSYFKKRRYHPILRIYRPHHGVDYSAARGTPVSSVGDGVVVYKGWKGGNGKLVKIRHRNSAFTTSYGHLSRYGKKIRTGGSVKQGQIIGYVGSTGLSTGPHLHFGVEKNGRPINFLRLKLPPARKITKKKELNKFNKVKENILSRLGTIGEAKGQLALLY